MARGAKNAGREAFARAWADWLKSDEATTIIEAKTMIGRSAGDQLLESCLRVACAAGWNAACRATAAALQSAETELRQQNAVSRPVRTALHTVKRGG
jgi:hypothetical protein